MTNRIRQIVESVAWGAAVGGLDQLEGINFNSLPAPVPALIAVIIAWALAEAKRHETTP